MPVAVSVFELHIPHARSLKEKRRVVKSLIDRIHRRYRVSIAETANHDLHQRSEISVAVVHSSIRHLEQIMQRIRQTIDDVPETVVTIWDPFFVEDRYDPSY